MKTKLFVFLFVLFSLSNLTAQTAARVEDMLNSSAVSMEQAAWLVLGASETAYRGTAFLYAAEQGWLPANVQPADSIRLDQASLLIMRAFDINGGLFFRLTGSPHYAYRELTYLNIIQERTVPGMNVSGEMLLFMVNRILSQFDTGNLIPNRRTSTSFVYDQEYVVILQDQVLADEIRSEIEASDITNVTVEATESGITISISDIQFYADSSVLPDNEKDKLREIADILTFIGVQRLMITGHTALAGTPEGRLQVSLDRAQAVKDYLVELGVLAADNISVYGYGSTRPIADNNTPEGMALNRRVEIIILEIR